MSKSVKKKIVENLRKKVEKPNPHVNHIIFITIGEAYLTP